MSMWSSYWGPAASAVRQPYHYPPINVLGLDRFPPGHDRGSSHGRTRIIRQAYFEHPDYVPLLRRAYELWEDLGRRRGRPLLHRIGLLQIGPADGTVLAGVRRSAEVHHLEVEELGPGDLLRRFPMFHADADWSGVSVPQACSCRRLKSVSSYQSHNRCRASCRPTSQ